MELVQLPGFKPAPKPFSWTYSKLKNFTSCPKRHYNVDIIKNPECFSEANRGDDSALLEGNRVHKILADAISKGIPLSADDAPVYQQWVNYALKIKGTLTVEQQFAMNAEFGPTEWFAKPGHKTGAAWHRSIADVVGINSPVAIALDWKTGKPVEDGVQLSLIAACIFAHYPQIMAIRTEFVWMAHAAVTRVNVHRSELPALWAGVLPKVQMYKRALDTDTFPATPNYLCKRYCPVRSCKHHGEDN